MTVQLVNATLITFPPFDTRLCLSIGVCQYSTVTETLNNSAIHPVLTCLRKIDKRCAHLLVFIYITMPFIHTRYALYTLTQFNVRHYAINKPEMFSRESVNAYKSLTSTVV